MPTFSYSYRGGSNGRFCTTFEESGGMLAFTFTTYPADHNFSFTFTNFQKLSLTPEEVEIENFRAVYDCFQLVVTNYWDSSGTYAPENNQAVSKGRWIRVNNGNRTTSVKDHLHFVEWNDEESVWEVWIDIEGSSVQTHTSVDNVDYPWQVENWEPTSETYAECPISIYNPLYFYFPNLRSDTVHAIVRAAGSWDALGVYDEQPDTVNGKPWFRFLGATGTDIESSRCIFWEVSNKWLIINDAGIALYSSTDDVGSPWEATTWVVVEGEVGLPVVTALQRYYFDAGLTITGAGREEVNGIYLRDVLSDDGHPAYRKVTQSPSASPVVVQFNKLVAPPCWSIIIGQGEEVYQGNSDAGVPFSAEDFTWTSITDEEDHPFVEQNNICSENNWPID